MRSKPSIMFDKLRATVTEQGAVHLRVSLADYGHSAELRTLAELANIDNKQRARELFLNDLKNFPKKAEVLGLRKMKTKYMVNALIHGVSDAGNHLITCYGNIFHFYYRGTLIYKWNAVTDDKIGVTAGEYEHTVSTQNQRREIEKAISNFKEAVMKL